MRHWLKAMLLLPVLASGCVTHKLWSEKTMDEWNEPAANPDLRLFHDPRHDDFLVVYDEYSDRNYTTKTRALYLVENLRPVAQNGRPHFVNVKKSHLQSPVPVLRQMPTNSLENYYAFTSTNNQRFTIFCGSQELGLYSLPNYNDGKGRWERIAWTPFTVTADLTIVGGCLALICWEGMSREGTSISVH